MVLLICTSIADEDSSKAIWKKDVAKESLFSGPVKGSLNGNKIELDHAVYEDSKLTLYKKEGRHIRFSVNINLFGSDVWQEDQVIANKTFVVRLTDKKTVASSGFFFTNKDHTANGHSYFKGFSMKLVFGKDTNGKIPGKIYITFPDKKKSFIAGSFIVQREYITYSIKDKK